ncbi:PREDICTED: soluble lamin-associated protein of 75 kDa, partial [Tauraco erythrolophus]|uniref:soluble lamin-associated protein of 75 kDa n=1 Tax=Tauraco erythrolophus TaxID=121530 RepID=UPI00052315F0
SICSGTCNENYKLPVLYTMFVRKKYRGKDSGLIMLEDFVNSFTGDALGLRYPLSSFMFTVCKQYLEKYPGNRNLLWEVRGAGFSFQRTSIVSKLQKERVTIADPNIAPVSIRIRGSCLKRPKTGKSHQESEPGTSQGGKESAPHVSKIRVEFHPHTSEDLVEIPENIVETDEETIVENEDQPVSEAELHVSPSEKRSEKEEIPSDSLNSEVTEETDKTSLMAEEETGNEVLSGESQLKAESQEETAVVAAPLIHDSSAESSEDTIVEKDLNASDSEVQTEGDTLVEEGGTEEQQEAEKTTTENAAASASKEDASGNDLPSPMVPEAAEESLSENLSPKTSSSLEDQNEEAGQNSQEAPVAVSQSSLIVVELENFSFQQPSGQEEQKNQLEEHSESVERMDQYTQTAVEQAADSSSEEAEIEVPVVDRRSLRRKAKGYKGPAKKKGKPA